jgi:hypothetical protein
MKLLLLYWLVALPFAIQPLSYFAQPIQIRTYWEVEPAVKLALAHTENYFAAVASKNGSTGPGAVAYYDERIHEYAQIGYQAAIVDSTQGPESIFVWLDRIHSFQAELAKADLHIRLGQQTQALACLNGISAKVNLTEEQAIDLAEILNVWTIVLSITPENRPQKLAELE